VQRLKLHKVLIQSLSFSHDEKFLASLGGQDDNSLVIWDVSVLYFPFDFILNVEKRMNYIMKRFKSLKLIFKIG